MFRRRRDLEMFAAGVRAAEHVGEALQDADEQHRHVQYDRDLRHPEQRSVRAFPDVLQVPGDGHQPNGVPAH